MFSETRPQECPPSSLRLFAGIARSAVLYGVDVVEEVDEQNNIGVAAIEAAISISIGLLFVALFA